MSGVHSFFTTLAAEVGCPADRFKTAAVINLSIPPEERADKQGCQGKKQVHPIGILANDRSDKQDQQCKTNQYQEGTNARFQILSHKALL
jgi:hypothetical protein